MAGGPSANIRVDASDLRKLYVELKAAEGNLQVELRRGIKDAAAPMVAAVKSAAASFSTRIPGAVRTKVSFAKRGASVAIAVDDKKAPHAKTLEHGGDPGTFRHPVFGNRHNWVSQQAHPFFYRSVDRRGEAEARIRQVMDDVAKKAGFTGT